MCAVHAWWWTIQIHASIGKCISFYNKYACTWRNGVLIHSDKFWFRVDFHINTDSMKHIHNDGVTMLNSNNNNNSRGGSRSKDSGDKGNGRSRSSRKYLPFSCTFIFVYEFRFGNDAYKNVSCKAACLCMYMWSYVSLYASVVFFLFDRIFVLLWFEFECFKCCCCVQCTNISFFEAEAFTSVCVCIYVLYFIILYAYAEA